VTPDELQLARRARVLFKYLLAPRTPWDRLVSSCCAFVFGRLSVEVGDTAVALYLEKLVDYILFTGGIGKDSDILADLGDGVPEAFFLAGVARSRGVARNDIYTDPIARNGEQNCRLGLELIFQEGLPHDSLILVCYPLQLRRLLAQFKAMLYYRQEALRRAGMKTIPKIQAVPSADHIDPANKQQQIVAALEVIRLLEWPERNGHYRHPKLLKQRVPDRVKEAAYAILEFYGVVAEV
jgi:hypothetical protein